ncbi:MAG: aspartyl/asparaginyl beta-hydroxylase domain-containing protein [Gammaproteobacteria bacterium]|nr:aspartyl/asparaginyl beta-hydroxylase domain-containing protein [Gammaproteobacteria bacterium]
MAIGDRIRIPLSLDLEKMREEVCTLPLHEYIEYSVLPLTAPRELPHSEPVTDYADGSWAEWPDTSLLEACPYLKSVVNDFRSHTTVTLVRLLRLAPGGIIKEHTDPTLGLEQERSVIRLTIPIFTNPGVGFFLNEAPVPMRPGECWYLRFTDPHRVVNDGETERINLSIDMIPNDWVRSWIQRAADA